MIDFAESIVSISVSSDSLLSSRICVLITAFCYIPIAIFSVVWFVRIFVVSKKQTEEKTSLLSYEEEEHKKSHQCVCCFLISVFV